MKGNIDSTILDLETYISNGDQVKNLVLSKLYENGDINEQQAIEYRDNWQIICIKKSWYRHWFNYLLKKDSNEKDGYCFKFVKF